jgi:hypothetical protein
MTMAGYFVMNSIPVSDLLIAQLKLGAAWSGVAHAHIGWSTRSRTELQTALDSGVIASRHGLPPHRYLQINAENPLAVQKAFYINVAGWVDALKRPTCAGLGLRQLCHNAQAAWTAGNKAGALIAQVEHGAVSVEIYHVSGEPVT